MQNEKAGQMLKQSWVHQTMSTHGVKRYLQNRTPFVHHWVVFTTCVPETCSIFRVQNPVAAAVYWFITCVN